MRQRNQKNKFIKFLWIGLAVALGVLMLISFSPTRHVTEVVLQ